MLSALFLVLALPGADETCRITGTVVDAATRAGVAYVTVVLEPGGRTTTAGDHGEFTFQALPAGRFTLTASSPGFTVSAPVSVEVSPSKPAAAVEIEYRFAMAAEAVADRVRPSLPSTPIASPSAAVLEGSAIEATPGALEDVFRALQGRPAVASSQDSRNDLLVRGGGAIENQVRIDGFDVPNLSHFAAQGGSGGAVSMIPTTLIQTAAFEAGGFSVTYGERASSVVDLTLRGGRADRMHASVGAGVGGLAAQLEGPIAAGRGSWLVSARRSLLEAVSTHDIDAIVPRYADGLARAEVVLRPGHQLTFLLIGSSDSAATPPGGAGDNDLRGTERIGLVGVRLDSRWGDRTSTTSVVSAGSSQVDAKAWGGDGLLDAVDRGREVELRWRGEVRHRSGRLGDLLAGVSVKHVSLDFELLAGGLTTDYSRGRRNIDQDDRDAFVDSATFVEWVRSLPGGGRASAGLRLDKWGGPGRITLSPRLKAEYPVGKAVRAVASWGVFRQPLPYLWMESDQSNVALRPISSSQGGAGLEIGMPRGWRGMVDAFDKRYHDYPVNLFEPARVLSNAGADFESPFVGPLAGGGLVNARGLDASLSGPLAPGLQVSVGCSFWRVSARGLDGVWRRAEQEVRQQGLAEISYRTGTRWSAGLRWRYASGRPYTPFDTRASNRAGRGQFDLSAINAAELPPYHRLDLHVDRTFRRGRTTAVVYAEAINAYNRRNLLSYTWSQSLHAARPYYQWGLTPVAGVRVEF